MSDNNIKTSGDKSFFDTHAIKTGPSAERDPFNKKMHEERSICSNIVYETAKRTHINFLSFFVERKFTIKIADVKSPPLVVI